MQKPTSPRSIHSAYLLAAAMAACSPAANAADQPYPAEWHGTVGIGVASKPEFLGSAERETEPVPIGKLSYGRFFIGGQAGLGLGYNAFDAGNFTFGAIVGKESNGERKASDSPRLTGLEDLDDATRAGLFVNYRRQWLRAGASVLWDVGGNDQGVIATLSAEAVTRATPALELSVGANVTYGNAEYQQSAFGITVLQSAKSGLAVYTPSSGASQANLQLGASYGLSRSWILGTRITAGRLLGDAAKSPVVEKKAQNSASVFVAYKF